MTRHLIPLALVLVNLTVSPAAAQEETEIQILAFGKISGDMVPMRCEDGPGDGATYAHLVSRAAALRAEAPTLTFLSGGLLGDDPFSRYMATRGAWALRRLEELVAAAALDAAVPGVGEFSLPGGHSIPILSRLAAGPAGYGALNLTCQDQGAPLCSALKDRGLQIHEVGGLRVAVLSLLGDKSMEFADPRNRDHKAIQDPAMVASEAATRLKASGEAELVVALVNLDRDAASPAAALAFTQEVKGVDLVITGGEGLDSASYDRGRRHLVGVAPGVDTLTRIRIKISERNGARWISSVQVGRVGTLDATPDPVVAHLLSQTVSEFCAISMRPLKSGRLKEPVSAWRFLRYVMEIARREMRTDLTIFTADCLWADPTEELEGALTAEDLNRMFPLNELAVLDVKGSALKSFLMAALPKEAGPSPTGLEILGAEVVGPPTALKIKINGRLLDEGRRYRLVTTRYLALGGRAALGPILVDARHHDSKETVFIRDLVRRFLDRDRPRRLGGNRPISPEKDFQDLWDLPRWDLNGSATLSFNQVQIGKARDVTYEDSQLNRTEVLGLNGDIQALAVLSNRIMLWTSLLQLQYGATSTGGGELQEIQDRIMLESAWSWTWLRNRAQRAQAWIPVPMLKWKLESEFTRAAGAPRHHLEGTVTIGPQWLFTDWASMFFGYGLRNELTDPGDPIHQGLEFGYMITRVPLLRRDTGAPILELESRFELFWSDIGARDKLKSLGTAALHVALLDWLRFTASVNAFVYKERGRGAAWALDNAAGLSLLGTFSVQKYW